jgi:isopentenyl-diphosphate delta-isomerase type 1
MEMFQLVDERGNPTGSAARSECHGNPDLIHLTVHLHVLDEGGRLFLQKRALTKDTHPGEWDSSVGGHVQAGESVEHALMREAREELGIDASGAVPLFGYLYRSGGFETEYARVFSLRCSGGFILDRSEIDEGRFFRMEEIERLVGTGSLTPMFEHELPMLRRALGV